MVTGCTRETPLDAEAIARDEFVRRVAERAGASDFWQLSARADLVFEDGCSLPQPADDPTVSAATAMPLDRAARGPAVRWFGPAAHLRVRGRGSDMRLRIWGRVDLQRLLTRPRIRATFDGREFDSRVVGTDGVFALETVVAAARLDGWSDVYLEVSSVHHPLRDAAVLRVARIEGVAWDPVE
ncbi:MAG: hypothetical protein JNK64_05845 [Myxococcales bacterium]|nr:hypothetical protein [Myxococcales bacterium]